VETRAAWNMKKKAADRRSFAEVWLSMLPWIVWDIFGIEKRLTN
jgi:hypothetical protein